MTSIHLCLVRSAVGSCYTVSTLHIPHTGSELLAFPLLALFPYPYPPIYRAMPDIPWLWRLFLPVLSVLTVPPPLAYPKWSHHMQTQHPYASIENLTPDAPMLLRIHK